MYFILCITYVCDSLNLKIVEIQHYMLKYKELRYNVLIITIQTIYHTVNSLKIQVILSYNVYALFTYTILGLKMALSLFFLRLLQTLARVA